MTRQWTNLFFYMPSFDDPKFDNWKCYSNGPSKGFDWYATTLNIRFVDNPVQRRHRNTHINQAVVEGLLKKNAYFLSAYKNESFILNLKDVRWYIHQSWWWWWRNAMNNIRFDRSTLKQMNSCIIKLYV